GRGGSCRGATIVGPGGERIATHRKTVNRENESTPGRRTDGLPDGRTLGTYDETDDSVMIWDVPPPRKLPPWLALTTLGGAVAVSTAWIYGWRRWRTDLLVLPPAPATTM